MTPAECTPWRTVEKGKPNVTPKYAIQDAAELLKEAHDIANEMGFDLEECQDTSHDTPRYAVVFARSRRVLSKYGCVEQTLAWLHALDCPF